MNAENFTAPSAQPSSTRHHSSKYGKSTPVKGGDIETTPSTRDVRIADILPIVLSGGILALLYFMMKEYNQEKNNTMTHLTSISKRLEKLELTSTPLPVAQESKVQFKQQQPEKQKQQQQPEKQKQQQQPEKQPDSKKPNSVLEADSSGTFEMKDTVVSFVPGTKGGTLNDIDEDSETESETDTEM